MDPGSYTGENGQFNPASYTRHFLGSPISWRAGSFGAQYCTSQSPTAMLVGSYECVDAFQAYPSPDRLRSPVKSHQDPSILNAWNVFDRQGELCRNYTCCGTHLPDLHALLEHFEEVHIVVVDRSQPPQIQIPFNPQMNPPESQSTPQPPNHQPAYSTPFDTDDMDLGLDYEDASPPPPSTAPTSTVTSRAPSPSPSPSDNGVQRPALNISLNVGFPFREGMHTPLSTRAPAPFSAYARYNAEYNSPGGVTSQDVAEYASDSTAVAPALVFATGEELQGEADPVASTSTSTSSSSTPSTSTSSKPPKTKRSPPSPSLASPVSTAPSRVATPTAASSSAASSALPSPTTTTPTTPSILLPHKPFRCPKPNCSKSYKQANGLKYHMTHGSCNFGPAKDLEAVRALLERKRASAAAATPPDEEEESNNSATNASANSEAGTLSQAEMNEVEARVRPFACGVGDCARRYKNMNGLRYHYQHSGDHGAVGLSLLAGGVHGCLKPGGGAGKAPASASTSTGAAAYAWGSTLLPHIQAVAATPTTTTATATKANSGKTEATPFTPPTTPATATPFTPPPTATPEYLAQQLQLQRAQYAQYQQAVAAGWYAQAQAQPAPVQPQAQVDVQMG
ncbi:hypothetical protein DFH07DRAFT_870653 [Mycena maculata]|uniref:C2H2-type domain-containing protein n=1 Tax=Mycena maculata TaxID=230809 RepID=A0AAD7I947_9AGAR|nr:hypothetical protein DFH07DRAFT_870653 [Mycena maculata]